LGVLLAILAWLWPIGIGGKMPVGGDVTQFFLGLMGFLGQSLRSGHLPVWNDLWTYGFPGIAESQMGYYYPIHQVLYRFLAVEFAYVASMMLHTVWGGLGAYWAARRIGTSLAGAAFAAIAWSMGGFFLVHLAHQWSYTTGCWMPWALGLTWCSLNDNGRLNTASPFLLSLVLVLQLLPGHFQLAFITQVCVLLILVWAGVEKLFGRSAPDADSPAPAVRWTTRQALALIGALAGAFPLAAIQLWPTLRLARLAASQRDPNYLSDFAATPFHLVNFVAPGLFHRSALWRPLVWDPFHTSPEENLAYIGLVPLCFAAMVVTREWRRDPVVRLLAFVFLVTLVLSLGPYAPGFNQLVRLPGFSFFRAPARWGIAASLALALLAGKGFDRWTDWVRGGQSLRRSAFLAIFWVAAIVGLIELALISAAKPGLPALIPVFRWAMNVMPRPAEFTKVVALARGPEQDPRVPPYLNRSMFLQTGETVQTFAGTRGRIYLRELGELAALITAVIVVATWVDRGRLGLRPARTILAAFTFLELWILGQHRLLDLGPLTQLKNQSPVLARIARETRGTRIADDDTKNLAMLVGMAPMSAYRTLDLPAVHELTWLTRGPLTEPIADAARRATGTGLRVIDPIDNRRDRLLNRAGPTLETIDDPAMAGWLYGASWVAAHPQWARSFRIWLSPQPPTRAWLVARSKVPPMHTPEKWSESPREILSILRDARPLVVDTPQPEEWVIGLEAQEPGWVIISQVADPQWTAEWSGRDGQGDSMGEIMPIFRKEGQPGGWQCMEVPASGHWTLRLRYDASDVAEGAMISAIAWLSWVLAVLARAIQSRRVAAR
jgi:hypothetical protein